MVQPETDVISAPTARGTARRIAPLAVGLLVIGLLAGVALTVRADGEGDHAAGSKPTVLRLTSTSGTVEMDPVGPQSVGNHYLLGGSLPGGRPAAAAVFGFGADQAPAELSRKLAGALGLSGNPRRDLFSWQLDAGSGVLTLQDGRTWAWQYGPAKIAPHTTVQCFRAPCPYEGPSYSTDMRGQPAPSPAEARRVATRVLLALGLPVDDLQVVTTGRVTEVRAVRKIDGKQADAFGTTISVGSGGVIQSGRGWLGQPRSGSAYPLVSAAEGFKRLQAQPHPEILMCRVLPSGRCAPTPQATVTGARLGLKLTFDAGRPLLVPAWLFTVAGQSDPVSVVAIDSRYLGAPPAAQPSSGIIGDPGVSGTGAGSTPNTFPPQPRVVPPDEPADIRPASPKPP